MSVHPKLSQSSLRAKHLLEEWCDAAHAIWHTDSGDTVYSTTMLQGSRREFMERLLPWHWRIVRTRHDGPSFGVWRHHALKSFFIFSDGEATVIRCSCETGYRVCRPLSIAVPPENFILDETVQNAAYT